MDNTKPQQLDLHSSNLPEAWKRWSHTMNLCLDGPLSSKSDTAKCSCFLLYMSGCTGCVQHLDIIHTLAHKVNIIPLKKFKQLKIKDIKLEHIKLTG